MVLAQWEHISEEEILNANIIKYNDDNIVNFYADLEESRYLYYEYEVIFQAVINVLNRSLKRRVRAVDICGGAGKAAFVVNKCDPSCEVTLVDVSRKMLEIAQLKAKRQRFDNLRIVQTDAFSFLEQKGEYDLIIFSSAIHHFKDPRKLLLAAIKKLSPEGIIITIADPTTLIKSKRYKIFEFLVTNLEGKKEVIKNLFTGNIIFKQSKNEMAASKCDIAEYQTLKGIDDKNLVKQLSANGLFPLVHLRYPAGEPYMTKIMPLIGLNWAFSLVLRHSNQTNDAEIAGELREEISAGLPFKSNFM